MEVFILKRVIYFILLFTAIISCGISHGNDAPVYKNPDAAVTDRVDDLLTRMTLDEKIGQMTQVDSNSINENDISPDGIGALLSGGDSMKGDLSAGAWADYCDKVQTLALKSRLGIPLLYGIDSVHGSNKTKGAVIFPHHIGLGAAGDPALVEKIARVTAVETRGSGFNWTFAPCLAVAQDERWGRTYESFSEDPQMVETLGTAEIRGLQGDDVSSPSSIIACAKHFLGDGGTLDGIDQGDVRADDNVVRDRFLPPYRAAVNADIATVMASYSSINGEKMHASKKWLTDVLKGELKFRGFVVSDWAGHKQLKGATQEKIAAAVNAGVDMIMVPDTYREFIEDLKSLVEQGKVPESRINDAVKRILTIKFKMGLFEHPLTDQDLTKLVGCKEHRDVARQAVRQSLVLLKNDKKCLPLSKDIKVIAVVGEKARDIGSQCGGWTIGWQGSHGNITEGTDILTAVKKAVSRTTQVIYSSDGKGIRKPNFAIVVVGESPYAEYNGDAPSYLGLRADEQEMITRIKKAGIPFAVILLSGRPLLIAKELAASDAFIAAWLPGTEAEGITDVLFGDFHPQGKLSFTWPANMSDIPINKGDGKKTFLFPFGFGLSY